MRLARPLLAISLVALAACSSSSNGPTSCAIGPMSMLTVSVVDDSKVPTNICDAKVVATGPTTVTLTPSGGSSVQSCDYVATVAFAGTYMVRVTASGYLPVIANETVMDGCNVSAAIIVTPVH